MSKKKLKKKIKKLKRENKALNRLLKEIRDAYGYRPTGQIEYPMAG